MSLPKTDANLLRLPSSWATEINLQSRYPGGIWVTKTALASCLACRDAAAAKPTTPTTIATTKAYGFIRIPLLPPKDLTWRSDWLDLSQQFYYVKIVEGNPLDVGIGLWRSPYRVTGRRRDHKDHQPNVKENASTPESMNSIS